MKTCPWLLLLYAFLLSVFEATSQACIKKARLSGVWLWLLLGALMYMIIVGILYISYKCGGMGKVNLMWSCMSIILAIITGIIIFKEDFNIYTILAIIFAGIAVFFADMS